MSKLDEIQARADAATEGPWVATPNDRIVSSTKTWPEGDPYDVAGMFGHKGAVVEGCRTPDALFIAHAREDVPKLVAALRAVEAVHVPWDSEEFYNGMDGESRSTIKLYCGTCVDGDERPYSWPCPTTAAIREALA
jgi:hypothetical protein